MKKHLEASVHSRNTIALESDALDKLAAEALTYLAAEAERLSRFFAETGITIATLRRAAGTPDFTAHLLNYLAADERRLTAFAMEVGRDPAAIEAIRAALTRSGDNA